MTWPHILKKTLSSTTYLPSLINVVCERPLVQKWYNNTFFSNFRWLDLSLSNEWTRVMGQFTISNPRQLVTALQPQQTVEILLETQRLQIQSAVRISKFPREVYKMGQLWWDLNVLPHQSMKLSNLSTCRAIVLNISSTKTPLLDCANNDFGLF